MSIPLKDKNLEPLFKRREELKNEINKDMEEYKAIEYVITKCRTTEEKLEAYGKLINGEQDESWDSITK